MRFVDTNVLLYAISSDRQEREKAAIANELLTCRDLALSVQVLQEFYVQATHRHRTDSLSHERAVTPVDSFTRFSVQETTIEIVKGAMSTCERFGISYWDAAIVEAARTLGCQTVLSEDLNDGQDYLGVRVSNPFA